MRQSSIGTATMRRTAMGLVIVLLCSPVHTAVAAGRTGHRDPAGAKVAPVDTFPVGQRDAGTTAQRLASAASLPEGPLRTAIGSAKWNAVASNATQPSAGRAAPGNWRSWFIAGTMVMGAGAGLGFYGVSDSCLIAHVGTTRCDNYTNTGIGVMVGGFAIMLMGLFANHTGAAAAAPAPAPAQPVFIDSQAVPPSRGRATDVETDLAIRDAQQAIGQITMGPHGTIPAPQASGDCRGTSATIAVTNRTAYGLTVYLAGAEGRTLVLSPGDSRSVQLTAGSYSVGARVNASNVLPYAGTWALDPCPYSSTFYIGQ